FVQSFTAAGNGDLSVTTDGSFEYDPDPGFVGTETITYTVSDGTETATGEVTINVSTTSPVANDPPVANDDGYTVRAGEALTVAAGAGLLLNDTDPDGDPLEVVGFGNAGNGSVAPSSDGSFTYTPDAGFVGTDSFVYTISDGLEIATATVTIDVTNAAPDAVDDSYTIEDGEVLTVAAPGLLANDTDADGDPLEVVGFGNAGNGSVAPSADGSFTYTPDAGFVGTDSFIYTITDGAETTTAEVTIEVLNQEPEINLIDGTLGRDILQGTSEADQFVFNGGFGDVAVGNGGDDIFNFTVNVENGVVDNTRIMDWSDGDMILGFEFEDVQVETVRSSSQALRFAYGPDNDVLTVTGDISGGLSSLFETAVA
ncbi:Ig-like domain-containing protein, partial [Roseovarius sp. D22-M7]|uniref:Ig-like domain-containing protein n=1 Tax=Roseovarius sp. D22-M7 TaxID=3127116 RepID=UPI00300FBEAF